MKTLSTCQKEGGRQKEIAGGTGGLCKNLNSTEIPEEKQLCGLGGSTYRRQSSVTVGASRSYQEKGEEGRIGRGNTPRCSEQVKEKKTPKGCPATQKKPRGKTAAPGGARKKNSQAETFHEK